MSDVLTNFLVAFPLLLVCYWLGWRGWRTRCLAAERELQEALAELADMRKQVIKLGGSPSGRR